MLKTLKVLEKRIARLAGPELKINPKNSPDYDEIKQIMGQGLSSKFF